MKKLVLITMLLFIGTLAFGQEVMDTLKLKEVEIISTYRPNDRTPVTESIIKKSDIKQNSIIQEVPVFLTGTPAMSSYSDGGHENGYTYMRLRGIDQTRINFTLNGVTMNECEDAGFYSSNFPDFLSSLNSIEIMRGVGPTTYGMSSYVGSINFESVNLQDSPYQLFTGAYGSFNTYKMSAEINTGVNDKHIGFYSRASMTGSNGYRSHSGNKGYSYFFSGGYYGNHHIVKTNAFIGNSATRMAWLGSSQAEIDVFGLRYNPNSANEWDNFTQAFVQVQDYYRLNTNSSLISTIYYNRLDGNWDLDLKNTFGDPAGNTINYQLWSNFTGVMVNYKYVNDFLRFNTGINGNYYERSHACSDKNSTDELYYLNKGVKNSASVYSKLEYDVRCLTLFGDIQYKLTNFSYVNDKIDPNSGTMPSKTWDFLSPKLGLSYCINTYLKSYIAIGLTRREPTRTDLFGGQDNLYYTDSTHTTSNYIGIKPEKVIDYEAGVKLTHSKISGNINIFYMDFKDEITLKGAMGANSLPLMTNVDNSFRSGIEIDLKSKLSDFTLSNTMSYMYCQIESDGRKFKPVMTPDLIINQGVDYTYQKLTIGIAGRYISKQYIDLENLHTLKPNFGLDAKVMFKYQQNDITIGVYNIFGNSNNISYSSGYMGPDGMPRYFVDAPRNVYVTLHIKL